MTNAYDPARHESESFEDYKFRRKVQNELRKEMRAAGIHGPRIGSAYCVPFKQRTATAEKLARRDTVKAIGRRQSRKAMRDVLGRN
jgi:hypothetical protein